MVDIQNWDAIQERQDGEFPRPLPGGYIVRLVDYEDNEEKQYLRLFWDFAEGEFKGTNQSTYNRAGFWPYAFIRSYKEKALPFFKGFKTCLELSNRGYQFNTRNLEALRNKLLGVVLGMEEYRANSGEIKERLYVAQVRSIKAIRDKDFKVPELKKYQPDGSAAAPDYAAPDYVPPRPYAQPSQVTQQGMNGYPQQSYTPGAYDPRVPGNWAPLPDDGDVPF